MPSVQEVCDETDSEALMYQKRLAGKKFEELDLSSMAAVFERVLNDRAYLYYLPFLLLVTDPRTGEMGIDPEIIDLAGHGLSVLPGMPFEDVFTPQQLNAMALYVLSFAIEEDVKGLTFRPSRDAYYRIWSRFALTPDIFEAI